MGEPAVPDVVGTVRGYRAWSLHRGWLEAKNSEYTWTGGVNIAGCERGAAFTSSLLMATMIRQMSRRVPGDPPPLSRSLSHQVPVSSCSCGFYACADPDADVSMLHTGVFGVVECSGGIAEQERNTVFRAQKAEIVALCMPWQVYGGRQRRLIRKRYPGARIFGDREKMLAAYPPVMPRTPLPRPKVTLRLLARFNWLPLAFIGVWDMGVGFVVHYGHQRGYNWHEFWSGAVTLTLAGMLYGVKVLVARKLARM